MSGFQLNAKVAKRVDLDVIPISLLKPVINRNYFALINLLKKNTYLANQISFFYYQQLVGNASLLNNNKESANIRVPWDSMYQDMTGKVLILSPYDQYQLYMWVTVNNTQNMATQSNFQFLLFSLGNYLTQLNTAQRTINQKQDAQHYYPLGVNVKTNNQMKRFLTNWVNIPSSPEPTPVPPTPGPTELVILPFTTVGSFTWIAPSLTTSVEYLVVGGGGGGGGGYDTGAGGGGGAGLVLTGTITVTPGTTYTIVVGDGGDGGTGSGSPSPSETSGLNGVTSGFYTILATGGSGGYRSRDQTGGTGVGGEIADANTFTAGGPGRGGGSAAPPAVSAGGGGGNGSAGANSTSAVGGIGGSGVSNSITGSSVTYGAGGNGGRENGTSNGVNGTSNTGNGAGGASSTSFSGYNGGKGGSGMVVLKYLQ